MDRTLKSFAEEPLSPLMGTLAITGYSAEFNLRDAGKALAQKDLRTLAGVSERNGKLARLRAEIDKQVGVELAKAMVGNRERARLNLTSEIARVFEKMGAHTVAIADLGTQLLLNQKPSRLAEVLKLIEHSVFIPDRAVQAFIDDNISWAKAAVEQSLAAAELDRTARVNLNQMSQSSSDSDRLELVARLLAEVEAVLHLVMAMAKNILAFLESAEL
jgi:PhoU domain